MDTSIFRIIKPMLVGDIALLSSNVPSTIQPTYASGTTYASGALAGTIVGTVQSVYKSLQSGNIGHAPATSPLWWVPVGAVYAQFDPAVTYTIGDVVQIDSPSFTVTLASALVGAVSHFRANGESLRLSTTGVLPPEYATGIEYFVVQATMNNFKLSLIKGGNPIVASGSGTGVHTATISSHLLFESLTATNVGNTPYKFPVQWLPVGVVNKYRMFDDAYQSRTENVGSISVSLLCASLVNSAAVLNSEGISATITQVESGYTKTLPLRSHPVGNWYDWYYTDPLAVDDLIFQDIPPFVGGTLNITINGGTGVAKCGVAVAGVLSAIGVTEWGASRSINDYSITKEDEWGNINLVPRAFSQRLKIDVAIARGDEDMVTRLLESYRAIPLVFVAAADYNMTYLYGFLGPWSVPITNSNQRASIELKGLV